MGEISSANADHEERHCLAHGAALYPAPKGYRHDG